MIVGAPEDRLSGHEPRRRRAGADRHATDRARSIVSVEHLTKIYEPSPLWLRFLLRSAVTSSVRALDDISIAVDKGTICAVVGPNGAGKSTLFRILTGLTTPTQGVALLDGVDVAEHPLAAREMVGFVPSGDQTLNLRLNCNENLLFHARMQGLSRRASRRRVQLALDQVGLGAVGERVGFALSAGMRARLQLARALLHRPKILILDEPTAAIDPVGSFELLQAIQAIVAEGGLSVLLSSHRLEEIEALHDQVAVLHQGRLLYKGDLDSFRLRYSEPIVELVFESRALAERARVVCRQLYGTGAHLGDDAILTVHTGDPPGVVLEAIGAAIKGLVRADRRSPPLLELLHRIVSDGESESWKP